MRILVMISDFSVGGAEKVVTSIINGFSGREIKITLAVFNSIKGNFITEEFQKEIEIVSFGKEAGTSLSFLREIFRFFRKGKPFDLIIGNLQPVAFYLGLLLPLLQCPVIYILHNDYSLLRDPFRRKVLRNFYKSDKVTLVSVSNQIADGFTRKFGIRPEVIENGIKPQVLSSEQGSVRDQIDSLKSDKGTVVFLGVQRLVWFKNLPMLAGAFREVSEQGKNAILVLLGNDPLPERSEESKIRNVGAPNVFLLGEKKNIADYLNSSDCFCIVSSSFEGSSVALLEALSFGLPVIGTRIGGIPSVIRDPENGILCEAAPEAIKEAITRFLKMSQEERSRISKANISLFNDHYNEKVMIEKYEDLIKRITSVKK